MLPNAAPSRTFTTLLCSEYCPHCIEEDTEGQSGWAEGSPTLQETVPGVEGVENGSRLHIRAALNARGPGQMERPHFLVPWAPRGRLSENSVATLAGLGGVSRAQYFAG